MFFFSEAVWSFQGLNCSLKLLAAKWSGPRAFDRGHEGIPMYWFIQNFFLDVSTFLYKKFHFI